MQESISGGNRIKSVSDYPKGAAMTPTLKTTNFPAGKNRILRYVAQSTSLETRYVLPLVQRTEDRRYDNVSEIAEAAKMVS